MTSSDSPAPRPELPPGAVMDTASRSWGSGWRRYFFPAFWLVYLGQAVGGVAKYAHGAGAVVGYTTVVVFAACYLTALTYGRTGRHGLYWALWVAGLGLTVVECLYARQDGLVFLVYLAVLLVASQRPWTIGGVVVLAVGAATLPLVVPGWSGRLDTDIGLSVLLVSLAMYGFFRIIYANVALSAARAEVARLAAENERSRIARDLHDLLGHSLTTITVKAGLARRLGERGETERALAEITEVEQLSRRTLGDVRAAVSAHREVSLAGELATAREVLRASGIEAELPATVAESDPTLSELFGWVVREGVTNVVRHSRAEHVRIALGRWAVEIVDDGHGGRCDAGNGLSGLRERAEAMGGTVTVSSTSSGFTLRVEVLPVPPERATAPAAEPPAARTQALPAS
ncbi:sensor histidine kinase [uncultured Jatrophihabitans sp.]|uniref:sensor histidine kinase n=1 Tax=uncultured Jatrophihabitans sp. TaxID=1610747 RepID=UPI0035CAA3B9